MTHRIAADEASSQPKKVEPRAPSLAARALGTTALMPPKPLPGMPNFRFFDYDELEATPDAPFVVEGLIEQTTVTSIYGPPGSFKSFLALAMALSIANGKPFGQRGTTQGAVCYVAAEGGKQAFHRRRKAWDQHYSGSKDAPLRPIFSPITLTKKEHLRHLATLIKAEEQRLAQKFRLIVIDTLARCFDGDENSALGMGALVKACDWLKVETDATVLLVAHTGKDVSKGIRGSNAFEGASETLIAVRRVKKQLRITVQVDRQKDGEEDEEGVSYGMKQVTLPDGKTSLVVDFDDKGSPVASEKESDGPDRRAVMMQVLRDHSDTGLGTEEWQKLAQQAGVGKHKFYEIHKELKGSSDIRMEGRRYFAAESE